MTRTYIVRLVILISFLIILFDISQFSKQPLVLDTPTYFRWLDWLVFAISLYFVFKISRYPLPDDTMNKLIVRTVFFSLIFAFFIVYSQSYIFPLGALIGYTFILNNELKQPLQVILRRSDLPEYSTPTPSSALRFYVFLPTSIQTNPSFISMRTILLLIVWLSFLKLAVIHCPTTP